MGWKRIAYGVLLLLAFFSFYRKRSNAADAPSSPKASNKSLRSCPTEKSKKDKSFKTPRRSSSKRSRNVTCCHSNWRNYKLKRKRSIWRTMIWSTGIRRTKSIPSRLKRLGQRIARSWSSSRRSRRKGLSRSRARVSLVFCARTFFWSFNSFFRLFFI